MSEDGAPKDPTGYEDDESPPLEQNIKSRSTWMRLFFMLVMMLLWSVSRVVVATVILVQFLCVLFTGKTNDRLKHLGEQLARYTYQIIGYLTFNTDDRPFPFDMDWPSTRALEREEE
jgi:hypothetical protein